MNINLIQQIIIVAIGGSIISSAIIQKIKEQLKSKKWLFWICLIISMATGICFSLSFSDLNIVNSIWVGIMTWAGADAIYKAFEEKIFTPFGEIVKKQTIEIPLENEIK